MLRTKNIPVGSGLYVGLIHEYQTDSSSKRPHLNVSVNENNRCEKLRIKSKSLCLGSGAMWGIAPFAPYASSPTQFWVRPTPTRRSKRGFGKPEYVGSKKCEKVENKLLTSVVPYRSYRVFRGGGSTGLGSDCRVADRNRNTPSYRFNGGFRLSLDY